MTLIEQRERTRQINEEKSKFPSTTYPTLFLKTNRMCRRMKIESL